MKLFCCYRRLDQHLAVQVVQELEHSNHQVWYDDRLNVGQNWWDEILRRLSWAEGMLFLISPESVQSEFCMKELRIALKAKKPVFPILLVEGTPLPEEIAGLHYVDMTAGMNERVQKKLMESIALVQATPQAAAVPLERIARVAPELLADPSELTQAELADSNLLIDRVNLLMDHGKFEEAVVILERAIGLNVFHEWVPLEKLLAIAKQNLQIQIDERKRLIDYRSIESLIKRGRSREIGIESFRKFQDKYPDFDPSNLKELITSLQNTSEMELTVNRRLQRLNIALLEWVYIPAGELRLLTGQNGHTQKMAMTVNEFYISKYPVTNAQYQLFLEDDPYRNARWWGFSPSARQWWLENKDKSPKPAKFTGPEMPRANVTWYEAYAYTLWLSARSGLRITLPYRQQWQRAARGDDERTYPAGDVFLTEQGNTAENREGKTTDVRAYPEGISPFGVYDMAGNVWEWCMNVSYKDFDVTSERPRAVQGGSYIGPCERAAIQFHYPLQPYNFAPSIGFRLACQVTTQP